MQHFTTKKYMLFTGWEVRIEKYFVEISKTVRGRRPRDVFETETKYFLRVHCTPCVVWKWTKKKFREKYFKLIQED
jgi:hypothetical protein